MSLTKITSYVKVRGFLNEENFMFTKSQERSLFSRFLYNLIFVAVVNTIIAFVFIKGLDNLSNPFTYFCGISLVSAIVVTIFQNRKKSV